MIDNTLNFILTKHLNDNVVEEHHYCALITSDTKKVLYGKEL